MDYTFSRVKEPNQDETTDADLLFGPFGRFFLPLDDDISLFVEGTFGYGNSSDDLQVGTARQRINTNIVALGVGPGLSVYSNSGFGIEAVLKYNFARSKFDTEVNGLKTVTTTKTNAFDFSIGVVYYFEGFRRAGG
jgi:outer membrane autotransporter protein